MRRPVGITILAVLSFVNVATYAVLLVLALLSPDTLSAVLKGLSPGGAGPEVQLRMGRLLPVYYGFGMVGTTVIGVGFWKLWNWTRVVVLVLLGASCVALLVEAVTLVRSGSVPGMALWVVRFGLCAFFTWYLASASVRTAFGRGSVSHAG